MTKLRSQGHGVTLTWVEITQKVLVETPSGLCRDNTCYLDTGLRAFRRRLSARDRIVPMERRGSLLRKPLGDARVARGHGGVLLSSESGKWVSCPSRLSRIPWAEYPPLLEINKAKVCARVSESAWSAPPVCGRKSLSGLSCADKRRSIDFTTRDDLQPVTGFRVERAFLQIWLVRDER